MLLQHYCGDEQDPVTLGHVPEELVTVTELLFYGCILGLVEGGLAVLEKLPGSAAS